MLRVVNLERLKKLYATFSVPRLLTEHGIEDDQLVPPAVDPKTYFDSITTKRGNFTPLWYYDNVEFDRKNADEWVKKNVHNDVQLPVPALVYLPVVNPNDGSSDEYGWTDANIIAYDPASKLYSVVLLNRPVSEVRSKVPRIQVHFKGEDPRAFANRIKYAVSRRDHCENLMLWYMYMDKIQIYDISKHTLSNKAIKRILILIEKKLEHHKHKTYEIIKEIISNHKRTECSLLLLSTIKKRPKEYEYIKVPNFQYDRTEKIPARSTELTSYVDSEENFKKEILVAIAEVVSVLLKNEKANILMHENHIYLTRHFNSIELETLDMFESLQSKHIIDNAHLLKEDWVNAFTVECRNILKNMKDSWFDISLSDVTIYKSSINKLRRLLILVQIIMLIHLRHIVLESGEHYADLFEKPCVPVKDILDNDNSWSCGIRKSFEGSEPPLFLITLNLNENGPFYTTDLNAFESVCIDIFIKGILKSYEIPAVNLLTIMILDYKLYLTSVALTEAKIIELQSRIENSIRSAIVPLKAYCKNFFVFLPLFNTDVQSYITSFFDGSPSPLKIKEEIEWQIEKKNDLYKTIPEAISIGLFRVNMESLKNTLVGKRDEMANSLMSTHAGIMCEQLESCRAQYKDIYTRLNDRAVSIEQLFERKEWIDTLPTLIENLSTTVNILITDMDILNSFYWILEQEQLQLKSDAHIWPYKINLVIKKTLQSLAMEIENFEIVQFEDESRLQDKIEEISSAILKLTIENNLSKVNKIAVDVNSTWKQINELYSFSQTLNLRQKLFGHVVIPYENINTLRDEFIPYKELWLCASDFLKSQKAWLQNPLKNIEENTLEPQINKYLETATKCVEQFSEVPGTLSVAIELKKQIEAYKPMITILRYLSGPGMTQRHFDRLGDETGVRIKLSPTLTFSKCLDFSIGRVVEQLKTISENALSEYQIEDTLKRMQESWNGVKLKLIPYKDSGTYIIEKISDELMQMLDDQISLSEQLSQSSFTGIFEEPLLQWAADLRRIRNVITIWTEFQEKWMYLEPIFSNPEIENEFPVEYKKFSLVKGIWKRVMKIALNNSHVFVVCTDQRILNGTNNGNNQLEFVQKKYLDYLEKK